MEEAQCVPTTFLCCHDCQRRQSQSSPADNEDNRLILLFVETSNFVIFEVPHPGEEDAYGALLRVQEVHLKRGCEEADKRRTLSTRNVASDLVLVACSWLKSQFRQIS